MKILIFGSQTLLSATHHYQWKTLVSGCQTLPSATRHYQSNTLVSGSQTLPSAIRRNRLKKFELSAVRLYCLPPAIISFKRNWISLSDSTVCRLPLSVKNFSFWLSDYAVCHPPASGKEIWILRCQTLLSATCHHRFWKNLNFPVRLYRLPPASINEKTLISGFQTQPSATHQHQWKNLNFWLSNSAVCHPTTTFENSNFWMSVSAVCPSATSFQN